MITEGNLITPLYTSSTEWLFLYVSAYLLLRKNSSQPPFFSRSVPDTDLLRLSRSSTVGAVGDILRRASERGSPLAAED